jgi:carboxylesterase type B
MRPCVFAASMLMAPLAGAAPGPPSHRGHRDPGLTVHTTSGIYTGLVNSTTAPDVNQWLGIPYARPPLGSLRFMPPEKAPHYGTADAKVYKPICTQNTGSKAGNVYWGLVPEFQNTDPESEDCLYLNIWAPRKLVEKKAHVPVIIYVAGGGFKEGGGHAEYLVPDQWIQRAQTHIVVTFKYVVSPWFGAGGPEG